MTRPDFREFRHSNDIIVDHRHVLEHSAEGSSWKKHKYVKKIDGVYYYPIGYDDGRTIDELKGGDSKNKEDQINEIKNHFDKYLSERGIDWTKLPKEEVDEMQRDLIDQLKGKGTSDSKTDISKDDVEDLAKEVIRGKMGNGQERKDILGERYEEVQKRVNELMKGSAASKKISSEKPSAAAEEAAKKAISLVKAYRTKDKKKN